MGHRLVGIAGRVGFRCATLTGNAKASSSEERTEGYGRAAQGRA
jgi:hypothetical protein